MRTLQEIIGDISDQELIISQSKANENPKMNSFMEGRIRDAEAEIKRLSREYSVTFPYKVEVILANGNGVEQALDELKDLGVLLVDAQEFYKISKLSIDSVSSGSNSAAINMVGFVEYVRSLDALAQAAGVKLPKPLTFMAGDATKDVVTNLRDITRQQFGGAGAESTWVRLKSTNLALQKRVDKEPVALVVHNTEGASANDYRDAFFSVHSVTFDTGSEEEVVNALKSIQGELKKQGKITKTNKNKQKQTENTQE